MTKDQVQTCRQRGQKVILTVGGASNGYNFSDRAKSQNFVTSFQAMYTAMGGSMAATSTTSKRASGPRPAK